MLELCPERGFLHFWSPNLGQYVFGQVVFDVSSLPCVINNINIHWSVATGHATHQLILFIAPTRWTLTWYKLYWTVQMVITCDYPVVIDHIFVENRDFYRVSARLSVRPSIRLFVTFQYWMKKGLTYCHSFFTTQ